MPEGNEGKVFQFNLNEEIDRFFDESSRSTGGEPRLAIIMGGVAVGKTTFRKQQYPNGRVVVDAVEIFLHLSRGEYFPFPGPLEQPLEIIGPMVAQRAVTERRNIVIEVIGAEREPLEALINAMKAIGYKVELQLLTCEMQETLRRNENRGPDDISAYYAEPFHRRWLQEAAEAAKAV